MEKSDLLFYALELSKKESEVWKERESLSNSDSFNERREKDNIIDELSRLLKINQDKFFTKGEKLNLIKEKIVSLQHKAVYHNLIATLAFSELSPEEIDRITAANIEGRIEYLKSHFYSDENIQTIKAESSFSGFNAGWLAALNNTLDVINSHFHSWKNYTRKDFIRFIRKIIKESNAGKS